MRKKLLIVSLISCFLAHSAWAELTISRRPACVIQGPDSGLERPEGITFSPTGDLLAVANSAGPSVTVYRRTDEDHGVYERTPACILKMPAVVRYPHDVEFSPCGEYLAVASRDNNSIVIFQRKGDMFHEQPYWVFDGAGTKLNMPAGLSFSPDGKTMGVANRAGNDSVLFFSTSSKKKMRCTSKPFQVITNSELLEHEIAATHAIAFAPDGNHVALVNKRTNCNGGGKSALVILEKSQDKKNNIRYYPVYFELYGVECLHSINYHPSGKYLGVTHEREDVWIYEQVEGTSEFRHVFSIGVDKKGNFEGSKGVAFSPDGKSIAISTMVPEIIVYDITE
ncbi:MAG: WD40 repeat domain-containing protein [Chlamydiales bacterium]|nr:WD40 repeat domain-containing protein [Chlamydiales bacterium]